MRRAGLAIAAVVLAATAGTIYGLSRAPSGVGGGAGGATGAPPPPAAPEAARAPSLASRPAAVAVARGATALGVVRRDGAPVAAAVTIARVGDADLATNPFARRRAALFERLLAGPASPTPVATVRAGDDGRFEFHGLAVGLYRVSARASGGEAGSSPVPLPAEGMRARTDVDVRAQAESLAGRAVKADGSPWSGRVVVSELGPAAGFGAIDAFAPEGVAVDADPAGRFVASGLPRGEVVVTALAEGMRVTSLPVALPRTEGEFVFVVDASLSPLEGRVVADEGGGPIAGAVVESGGSSTNVTMVATKATTDAEGRFRIEVLAGNRGAILAQAEGYAPKLIQGVAPTPPLEVRLARGARVVGRVTSTDGTPVEGVTVSVLDAESARGFQPFASEPGTTGADGRYEIDGLAARTAMVLAQGGGWITKGLEGLSIGGFNPYVARLEAGKTATADLVVVRGARVEGSVLDAEGKPVAGAFLRAESQQGMSRISLPAIYMRDAGVAASGADGAFVLDGLVPGTPYVVHASAVDQATQRSQPVTPAADAPTRLEIRFAPPRSIDVLVLDDQAGTPLAGAHVTASVAASGAWRSDGAGSWTTGPDGRARVGPMPPGRVRLRAREAGHVASADVEVEDREAAATIRLAAARSISGVVVGADGKPARDATVRVEPGASGPAGAESTRTDDDGRFRVTGAPRERVTLSAIDPRGDEGTAAVEPGADGVTVVLRARSASRDRRSLTVRVLDPSGNPVPRARVSLRRDDVSSSVRAVNGIATLTFAGPGPWTLLVSRPTDADGAALPYGTVRIASIPPDRSEVEVRLPPERTVSGVVRGPDGTGIQGVLVTASLPPAPRSSESSDANGLGSARTGADGSFRVGGLGDEDVELQLDVPPDLLAPDPVPARPGSTGVEIVLRPGLTATVTVVDPDGAPVESARVEARPVADAPRPGRERPRESAAIVAATDAKGRARLRGVDVGRAYALSITPAGTSGGAGAGMRPHREERWSPRDETIRLERAYAVSGVVRDLAGHPIAGASVVRRVGEQSWEGGAQSDANGAFVLRDVPAGEVVIRASVGAIADPRTEGAHAVEATVRAGAKDVVLALDPGVEMVVGVENWGGGGGERRGQAAYLLRDTGMVSSATIDADGTARFRGLSAGAGYTLWIPPGDAGTSVYRKDVHPGDVRVRLERGRSITGRVRGPAGATEVHVYATSRFMIAPGKVAADGAYEIAGVPEGPTWTVTAQARSGETNLVATADGVAAGGSADLELKAR